MFQDNPPPSTFSIHDWIRTISIILTFFLAIINLIYAIRIFNYKDKKDDENKERDLRVNWFKSLILDYHLESFYEFFQDTEKELVKLKKSKVTNKDRQQINETIIDKLSLMRKNFIEMLGAVDEKLYSDTLNQLDKMVDCFTETIFDTKINLSDPTVFDEKITNEITKTKTKILKTFFDYKG